MNRHRIMSGTQPSTRKVKAIPHRLNTVGTKMKLSIKQRIRNWLMTDTPQPEDDVVDWSNNEISLDSNGFRLQVYRAHGGTVVETTKYDTRKDESRNSLYAITEDKDLGEEIGKIITMENLR